MRRGVQMTRTAQEFALASLAMQGRFSGVVLVRQESETLLEGAYGDADRETGRPNTPETAFQIASISKQFTAAAILLLQERKMLSVDDSMHAWTQDCPADWEGITLHHLLTHTSGIGHWRDFPGLDLKAPISREALLRTFLSGRCSLRRARVGRTAVRDMRCWRMSWSVRQENHMPRFCGARSSIRCA